MTKNKDVIQRTKPDLIKMIRQKSGFSKTESKIALEAVLESIRDCLAQGESINCIGFGKFHIYERPGRMGRNPKTGESMQVESRKITKFAAGDLLKNAVNGRQ